MINVKLGYACINLSVPTKFRTCRLKTVEEQGMEKVKELTLHNFQEVLRALRWNVEHNISFFRLSSDLVPFASHEIMDWEWFNDEEVLNLTSQIKELAEEHEMRLSMHPGQYTILNSNKDEVIRKAVLDLEYHARVLELVGGSDMIIHVGGAYGDKEKAKQQFISSYQSLSEKITSKLILENDDKVFHLKDVIDISEKTGVPVCFDIHHHRCNPYPDNIPLEELLQQAFLSWKHKRRPKVHISSGKTSPTDRTHHDYVFEDDFDALLELLGEEKADIMLEAKRKEEAVLRIQKHLDIHPKIKS
nr:UV DNA damage repair endonuclease UvsE [Alkalicoccus halolimnae]